MAPPDQSINLAVGLALPCIVGDSVTTNSSSISPTWTSNSKPDLTDDATQTIVPGMLGGGPASEALASRAGEVDVDLCVVV